MACATMAEVDPLAAAPSVGQLFSSGLGVQLARLPSMGSGPVVAPPAEELSPEARVQAEICTCERPSAPFFRPAPHGSHDPLLAVFRCRTLKASTTVSAAQLLEKEVVLGNSGVPAYTATLKELQAVKVQVGNVHASVMGVAQNAGTARSAAAGLLASGAVRSVATGGTTLE